MRLWNKLIIAGMLLAKIAEAQPSLDSSFLHPPASAKPWVFWYWMQAAVSKAGIRADLQAMKDVGIGGAYLMPIKGVANPPLITPPVEQGSPAWWEMVRYAMQEADRLGLKLAMHACDGFAVAGGPWITPELSMQKITWTRVSFEGGGKIDRILPQPETNEQYYRDIAVLAFPTPAAWDLSTRTVIPQVSTDKGASAQYLATGDNKGSFKSEDSCWIQYAFDRPFTCRTIVVHAPNNYQAQRLIIAVSDDGTLFRRIGRLVPPRHGWQDGDADVTHTIAATTARYFRFIYDKSGSEPGAEDLDAAKWKPSLKLSGIELSAMPAIDQFEGKTGEVWRVSPSMTKEQLPDSLCIPTDKLINISRQVDAAGHLVWNAPAGHWTVLRIGHTSTGHTNATGGADKGLECDKFNPRAAELQFDRWFGETIRRVGPELAGRVLKIFHVDSWECGSQNWSPVFREEFRRRRGYELEKWLPAMAGVPIGTADSSERFLHDIRQTIAELIHDEFYATMAKLAHAKGCSFSAESVAPTITSDGMLHYDQADIPMGEFWLRSPTHDKPDDMLDAISGAHIYGKPVIQAEGFTELRMAWDEYPGMLKTLQDRNYALGINRLVFHVFTHNPWTDRRPGMTLDGVGTFLQRDQTWWQPGKAWIDYTQRCQWLLQQGRPVVDLAVFTGEEIPRRAVLPENLVPVLPGLFGAETIEKEAKRLENIGQPTRSGPPGVVHSANMAEPADWIDPLHGYAFDSFNPDVLLRLARVKDGRIELPGGASYALLVLPGARPLSPDPLGMSAAVAARLLQLVQDGATVLVDDAVVYRQLLQGPFEEIKDNDGKSFLMAKLGKGRVIKGPFASSSFDGIGLSKDLTARDVMPERPALAPSAGITYTHRTAPGLDIYFVSNQTDRPRSLSISLRVTGREPELWDPVTGSIRRSSDWVFKDGRTLVSVFLPANGSIFIVLRHPTTRKAAPPAPLPSGNFFSSQALTGPWTVRFDPALGGPSAPVNFDTLQDWSRSRDSAICYYSGTALYRQSFNEHPDPSVSHGRVLLDLGEVNNIARVRLNGVDCGVAWTFPYTVDITNAVKSGVNELEIEVTNTWANRLTGDRSLPENKRITWTTAPYHLDGKLLPAGLLGPVQITWVRE